MTDRGVTGQRSFAIGPRSGSTRTVVAVEISVGMCTGGRDLTEPKLSPDGSTVAFVARWGSECAIVTVPVDGGPERLVTTEPKPAPGRGLGGGCFDWVPDGTAIVYAARDGDLGWQPVPGGPPTQVTTVDPDDRYEAPVVTPDGSGVVAVLDQAELWLHEFDGLDGLEGEPGRPPRRLDDGNADFVFDPFVTSCGSTVLWTAWNVPDMPWDAARVETLVLGTGERGAFVGPASVHQPRTLPDGRGLAIRDDTGWSNLWLGDEPLVAEPFEHAGPTWGQGQRSYAASPDGERIAFTRNEAGFGRLCVVDVASGDVTEIARGVHGQLTWVRDRLVALRSGARTPTQVVAYDTTATAGWGRTVLAVGPVAGWEAAELPEPELVEVDHGGVALHARRYVAGGGRTICWVHGGPTDQWQVEFMPRIAYWWSRGWDVLVPDPRGSTGHGRAYQQALRGEWGRLDVDDAAAILRAEQRSGRATAATTALMGSSSGGLTVLGVLAKHHGLAAAAVTLYPVADLRALAEVDHRFEAHYTESLVGPPSEVERYRERSPVEYAAEIRTPLLVMHGDADPVVPVSSSHDLVDRIRATGGTAELVVFEGEGHGFRDPANKLEEYTRTEAFLAAVIGGR